MDEMVCLSNAPHFWLASVSFKFFHFRVNIWSCCHINLPPWDTAVQQVQATSHGRNCVPQAGPAGCTTSQALASRGPFVCVSV